jgi:hypothetical protein
VGIILNAPSVCKDADIVAARDLGLEPEQVPHEDLPPCPKAVSFGAVSLRDSTRGPNVTTRDSAAWASHQGHAAFLNGDELCKSTLILGDKTHDAPLLSDQDNIRQLWSSDASVETIWRASSSMPFRVQRR